MTKLKILVLSIVGWFRYRWCRLHGHVPKLAPWANRTYFDDWRFRGGLVPFVCDRCGCGFAPYLSFRTNRVRLKQGMELEDLCRREDGASWMGKIDAKVVEQLSLEARPNFSPPGRVSS